MTNTEAPKGTDLRVHDAERLLAVAAELNARPRKTLGWDSPAQRLVVLSSPSARGGQPRSYAVGARSAG